MFTKLLIPFSAVYGFFAVFNRYAYESGIRKRYRLEKPVISVGNLSAGGTGKTPVVVAISKFFQSTGKNPVVLSRGYRRKSIENTVCNAGMTVSECGDEPLLMARKGITVVVGKDRVKSARLATEKLNPDVFILDDGFQHHRIEKNFNVMVVDATKPFWEDRLLPAGRLREPVSFYRYADCFVITRLDRLENKDDFISRINSFEKPFFVAQEEFGRLYNQQGETINFSNLSGKEIIVMAGLGNNGQFFRKMTEFSQIYGFKIAQFLDFPDHYHYKDFTPDTNKIYITTEKDIVKLNTTNTYAVEYNLKIEDKFFEYMMEKIDGRKKPA